MKKRLALCFVLLCVVALTACLLVACGDGGKSSSDSGYNGGGSSGGSGYNSTTMVDLIRSKGRYMSNGDYQYSIGTQDYYGYDFDIYLQCSSDMNDVFTINATYGSIELTAFVYLNPQKVQVWTKRGSATKFAAEINSYSRATSDYLDYWTINIYDLTTASEDLQLAEYAMYCFPVYEWLFYTTNSVLTMRNFSVTLSSMGFSLKNGSSQGGGSQGGGSQGGGSHTTCSHHTGTWTCSTCGADLFSLLDTTIKKNATESSGGKYTVNYEVDSSTLLSGITDGSTVKLECLYYSDGKGWLTVLSISKNRELGWSLSSAETKTVVIGTITSPGSLTTDNFGNCISISTTYYGTSNSSFVAAMLLVSINELFQYMNNLAFPEYLPSVSLANFGLSYFDGTEIYRFAFVSMTTEANNITIRYAKKGAPMPYVAPETRPGYKWLGWYDENDVNYDEYTTATSDMTFTPKWQIESYDVTLDANGGTVSQNSTAVEYNSKPAFPVPTMTGYTFDGWYDGTYSSAKQYTGSNGKMQNAWTETSGKTLYAHWTPISYMMTTQQNLYAAGSVTSSAFVDFDSEQTIVATTNIGYTWLGWYEDGELLTEDTSYTFKVEGDRSFTAKWKVCPVTIEKNKADAGRISGFDGRKIGSRETITAETNAGYTWIGWYDGDNLLTTSMTYLFVLRDEEKTLTAKWIKVDVEKNKADAGSVTTLNGTYHLSESVTVTAETNGGYIWLGWYDSDTLLTNNAEFTFVMSEEDKVYTAKWATITLAKNIEEAGGVVPLEEIEYSIGDRVALVATTNAGYTWLGWYDGETLLTNEKVYSLELVGEDKTCTATWRQNDVVTKNIEEAGTVDSFANAYKLGDKVTLTAETNDGYVWIGWYEGETLLSAEESYEVELTAEAKTFTAKWTKIEIEQNIASAGTAKGLDGAFKVGDNVTLTAETNLGYAWLGWYDGETLLTDETEYELELTAEAKTFTAKWEVLEAMLPFNFVSTKTMCEITSIKSGIVGAVVVPDVVTSIGTVFAGNIGITSVTVGSGVTSIEDSAFAMCSSLTKIVLSDSVKTVGEEAFSGCSALEYNVYGGAEYLGNDTNPYVVLVKFTSAEQDSVEIAEGCQVICKEAFKDCTALATVTIPGSLASIGKDAFNGCTAIATINYALSTSNWCAIEGLVNLMKFGKSSKELYFNGVLLESLVFTSGTTEVPAYAFRYCGSITSITFASSIECIGDYAFYGCSGLTSITIPEGVTSIGGYAFGFCVSLTNISIPSSVTAMGSNVNSLIGCIKLEYIEVSENNQDFYSQDGVLYNKAKTQFLLVPAALKGDVTISNGITSINASTFTSRTGLTSIVIPNSVTSIAAGAFRGCSSLVSMTIPFVGGSASATSASSSTLFGYIFGTSSYTGGTAVKQSLGSTSITYYIPSTLRNVTITGGNIFYDAFSKCSMLTSITIPNSVTSIGSSTFYNCSGLTSVTIPNSVTSIGREAFEYCSGLTFINYTGTKSQWSKISKGTSWNFSTGSYTIYCTDGTLSK